MQEPIRAAAHSAPVPVDATTDEPLLIEWPRSGVAVEGGYIEPPARGFWGS